MAMGLSPVGHKVAGAGSPAHIQHGVTLWAPHSLKLAWLLLLNEAACWAFAGPELRLLSLKQALQSLNVAFASHMKFPLDFSRVSLMPKIA